MGLLSDFGFDKNDGVLVAYLPRLDSVLQEYYKGSCKVYAQDGIVLDMLMEDYPRVKWWKVREAARQLHMGIVEPAWQGPASDFTQQRLDELRTRWEPYLKDEYADARMYVRGYSHGPWICLDEAENARAAEAKLEELDERFREDETEATGAAG